MAILAQCSTIFCPSESAAKLIIASFRLSGIKPPSIQVKPHEGTDFNKSLLAESQHYRMNIVMHRNISASASQSPALKLVAIGAISEIKGYGLLSTFAKFVHDNNLDCIIEILGWTCDDKAILSAGRGKVRILGKYEDADLLALLKRGCYDAALFLSICPETYSYTLSSAILASIVPIVTPLGALQERVQRLNYGIVLDEDPSPLKVYQACLKAKSFASDY
jgi:hypothetical protein